MAHLVKRNGGGIKHMQDNGPGVGMRITQWIFSYRHLKVSVLVL